MLRVAPSSVTLLLEAVWLLDPHGVGQLATLPPEQEQGLPLLLVAGRGNVELDREPLAEVLVVVKQPPLGEDEVVRAGRVVPGGPVRPCRV